MDRLHAEADAEEADAQNNNGSSGDAAPKTENEHGDDDDDDSAYEEVEAADAAGFDSGATAVVALLERSADVDSIVVANAGDSRCVLCRGGEAVALSHDHGPELKSERDRIYKAGGHVTEEGRVCGNLNLARAIGDHNYKQNTDLSISEQMITSLPEVIRTTVAPDDEFIVLACDGIWNTLNSQQVVDFVRERIARGVALDAICTELTQDILADDLEGSGTDNMTVVIVQIEQSTPLGSKREREDGITPPRAMRPRKLLKLGHSSSI
jgi:protein phosphatase 1G